MTPSRLMPRNLNGYSLRPRERARRAAEPRPDAEPAPDGGRDLKPPRMSAPELAAVARLLRPSDRVLECGAGGSTLWLAARVREVHTVEPCSATALRVEAAAPPHVTVHWRAADLFPAGCGRAESRGGVFDAVVMDARASARTVLAAAPLLREGGWLIIHGWFSPPRPAARAAELAPFFQRLPELCLCRAPLSLAVFLRGQTGRIPVTGSGYPGSGNF